ncbi:hypothetical protein C8J57DRAFT_286859 [Mycena rebaudengoi]|nr:hypothetical protein C8J57DRAFT_286859 [Mycena rebaudengoi]
MLECRTQNQLSPMSPHSHRIPEIHYLVIDQSASDKKELSRLSLVSPTWTSYTQSLLFACVELGGSAMRPAKFLALLQCNPTLGRHVRQLELRTSFNQVPEEYWLEYAAIMEFLDRSLLQDSLLRISGASFEIAKPVGAPAAATFTEVTSLYLTHLLFESRGVFFALLRHFCQLRALELWRLEIRSGGTSDVHSTNSPPSTTPLYLRLLSVDEESLSLVLDWSYAEHPTLDELLVGSVSHRFTALNTGLLALGPRLRHLTLKDCSPNLAEAIHLTPCTALRRVSFEGATKSDNVLSFIQQLASRHLERISLRLDVHVNIMGQDTTSIAWDQIDALLAGPDFPRLNQVVLNFNLWGSPKARVFRAAIQSVRRRWPPAGGADDRRY